MKTIKILHKETKEVIFSHTCENNTIGKTVVYAIKTSINLSGADLSGTCLRSSSGTNPYILIGADLRESTSRGSDSRKSTSRGADLRETNPCSLIGADLSESGFIERLSTRTNS